MPNFASSEMPGTCKAYLVKKLSVGHVKHGSTTSTVSTSCKRAVVISPTHQGRARISEVHITTKVSVSFATWPNKRFKSSRSSASRNTRRLTRGCRFRRHFNKRVKPPPPCLWWHKKNWNFLPVSRIALKTAFKKTKAKSVQIDTKTTTSMSAMRDSLTTSACSAARKTINRSPMLTVVSSMFATEMRHGRALAHTTTQGPSTVARQSNCSASSKMTGTVAAARFLASKTSTYQ